LAGRPQSQLDATLSRRQRGNPDASVLGGPGFGAVEVEVRRAGFDPGDHDNRIMGVSGRTLETRKENGHPLLKNLEGDGPLCGSCGSGPRLQSPTSESPTGIYLDDEAKRVVRSAVNVGRLHLGANEG